MPGRDRERKASSGPHSQTSVHGVRVVGGAAAAAHLAQRLVERQRRSVRPMGRHGLDRVGDGQNGRLAANLAVGQAVGVP